MRKSSDGIAWGSSGKDARLLNKFCRLLGKTEEADRKLLLIRGAEDGPTDAGEDEKKLRISISRRGRTLAAREISCDPRQSQAGRRPESMKAMRWACVPM